MKDFEKKLEKLETISEKMRTQSLPLDQAMKLFEEGTALVQELDKEISKAERKVEKLLSQPTEADSEDPIDTDQAAEESKEPLRGTGAAKKAQPKKVDIEQEEEPIFELFLD